MAVTNEDRAKAEALVAEWSRGGKNLWLAAAIAETLAAEREKARAPFLALADDYDEGRLWSSQVVDRIREAAQDKP